MSVNFKGNKMSRNYTRRIFKVLIIFLFQGILLFISARTFNWSWAWIFLLLGLALMIINFIVLPTDLIEERGSKKRNVKAWDKTINIINIVPTVLMYTISGFDFRFGWTGNINSDINVAGITFFIIGSYFFTWSMTSNHYFSTLVRLQNERGHKVSTQGPYKFIRHPGYVGYIIMAIATPIALGSLYGLIPSGITAVLFVLRTLMEDNTLKKELSGYIEYSESVKYRLIPFLW